MPTPTDLKIETFPTGSFACNCSLIYSESTKEVIVIDPGNDLNTIQHKLESKGLKATHLLHTHAHFDHIGESKALSELTGAKLCLHRGDEGLYEGLRSQGMLFGMNLNEPGKVDNWIEHDQTFGLDCDGLNQLLRSIHTPGHTPGSCCFFSDELDTPILFSGDTLFKRSIGRTDLPGGDPMAIGKSIKQHLYQLPDETLVITGHGPSTTVYDEKKSNPFVQA